MTKNPQFSFWTNNDGLVVSWLLGIMIAHVLSMIMGSDTARTNMENSIGKKASKH